MLTFLSAFANDMFSLLWCHGQRWQVQSRAALQCFIFQFEKCESFRSNPWWCLIELPSFIFIMTSKKPEGHMVDILRYPTHVKPEEKNVIVWCHDKVTQTIRNLLFNKRLESHSYVTLLLCGPQQPLNPKAKFFHAFLLLWVYFWKMFHINLIFY